MQYVLPACTRYQRSAYGQRSWFTTVTKSEKPKWDTQKEPFHTFKRRVMIWAELLKIEHLLTGPPLGDVVDFEFHDAARRIIFSYPVSS